MRVIRERMVELDFKEEFIEKISKEYSTKKIDEKLDLLMEKKNIQNPAGWLRTALKNDYRGEETIRIDSRFRGNDIKGSGNDNSLLPSPLEEDCRGLIHQTRLESAGRINPPPTKTKTSSEDKKILSTEEARERFHSIREQLMAMDSH